MDDPSVDRPFVARRILEARVGIEPTHKGFADLSLTTWVPRLIEIQLTQDLPELLNLTAAEV